MIQCVMKIFYWQFYTSPSKTEFLPLQLQVLSHAEKNATISTDQL